MRVQPFEQVVHEHGRVATGGVELPDDGALMDISEAAARRNGADGIAALRTTYRRATTRNDKAAP
jgi:hypothetical protein